MEEATIITNIPKNMKILMEEMRPKYEEIKTEISTNIHLLEMMVENQRLSFNKLDTTEKKNG
jgi:hypothetical protein